MNSSPNIIDIVKELQETQRNLSSTGIASYKIQLMQRFPDIAQALLKREEKLKIAVDGLEKAREKLQRDFSAGHEIKTATLIDNVLSRIRSLPSQ